MFMAQISVSNVSFCYESDNIFEQVSLNFDSEWRLGFIGRNGKGKTTFLRMLMGKQEYSGTITSPVAFDCFPYELTAAQKAYPFAETYKELKPGLELWRFTSEMDTQAPGDFLGGNTDISTLSSLVSQICAQSTPQSKPTWDWGPQKICCRAGPWQASLPGSEKGGEGPQSSSTAVHMLVHTCKQKNEGMALTRHGDHSHLLAAQLLLSFHFPLLAFLNRLQQAYAALGFIHESNLSWKKFRSRPERVHSATVRNTQTGCTRKG